MELNERDFRKSYRRWFRRNKWLALRVKYLRNDDVHVERDRPGWFSELSNDRLHVANSGSFLHHKCQPDFRSTGRHIAPFVVVNKRNFRESPIYRLCRCERQFHLNPYTTTTYILKVYGSQGQSSQCQTTVSVGTVYNNPPSCWITLTPQSGYSGSDTYNPQATLSW